MAGDFPHWPDFAALSRHGKGASLADDLGRSTLNVSVVLPYWTERLVCAHDRKTGQESAIRYHCPLVGGGMSPHTLLAVYNLQGALLLDAEPQPLKSRLVPPVRDKGRPRGGEARLADSGHGGLLVQRVNRDWLALTVAHEEKPQNNESAPSVTLFFNRLRRPHTYSAVMALAQGIRRDNRNFPFGGYR